MSISDITHKSDEELAVIIDYLIEEHTFAIMGIASEISNLIKEHGLCHHNMSDLITAIQEEIIEGVIKTLPSEITEIFVHAIEHEMLLNLMEMINANPDLASIPSDD